MTHSKCKNSTVVWVSNEWEYSEEAKVRGDDEPDRLVTLPYSPEDKRSGYLFCKGCGMSPPDSEVK